MKFLLYLIIANFLHNIGLVIDKDVIVHEDINSFTQLEIIESAKNVIELYGESGDFWNHESGNLDKDKYSAFISIFAGDAVVFDDVRWREEALNYSEYALLIYDNMTDEGLPFTLDDLKITRIDIDETGFYIVDLEVKKHVFSALNENQQAVSLFKGRVVNLNMRLDFPDYLISDARIQYIKEVKAKTLMDQIKKPAQYFAQKLKTSKR